MSKYFIYSLFVMSKYFIYSLFGVIFYIDKVDSLRGA